LSDLGATSFWTKAKGKREVPYTRLVYKYISTTTTSSNKNKNMYFWAIACCHHVMPVSSKIMFRLC